MYLEPSISTPQAMTIWWVPEFQLSSLDLFEGEKTSYKSLIRRKCKWKQIRHTNPELSNEKESSRNIRI